ncbi:hypothetical protein ABID21_003468 [Pseudorhizobium tarimense]|uniref:DUF3363 domain-containing protein n=1 Tax=Pseudorhizobium tarimense TaxID=1079109 RepID=A0ABV2HA07_9HYPH
MSDDEEFRFRPRPGRVRADAPKTGKAKSFLTQAKKIARQHSNALPWRPVIDRQLGKEVSGIVQGGSVSWQLGRQRGLGL